MLLQVEGISKKYGAVNAVDNLSFHIAEGEALGMMGPNGAGKTTVLNLIMGVSSLDKGTIRFAQTSLSGLSTSVICQCGIGRTYQIPQPFAHMTVLENLLVGELYGGRGQSMKVARMRGLEILERVGLVQQANSQAGTLGLLELKRLELARALSLRPRLLLLDEIAGGLVESEVATLKGMLLELKHAGQSMLIIEHVLSLLFDLSDRIIVLHFGRHLADGKPTEIIQNPHVIEAYLGTSKVAKNVLPLALTATPPISDLASLTTDAFQEERSEHPVTTPETQVERPMLVRLSQVSAAYGDFQALYDISLDIYAGEIVALIGLNGAGKTTLIRALTRGLPLKGGDVMFCGQSIARTKPYLLAELGIAQCIEGRKIFPELTILENLELGAYCKHARSERHETLKRVYALFPILYERRNHPGSTLSGGQQQMLAIGRALMALPKLIIFDEISLGLAPLIIDTLYEAIREINQQGMTVLLVEQSVQRSLAIAQRAYVIERGRIVLTGNTEDLSQDIAFRTAYFGL